MIKLSFEKISRHDRNGEFTETAIPFPAGKPKDVSKIFITDARTSIGPRTAITAKWPDGSVRYFTGSSRRPSVFSGRHCDKSGKSLLGFTVKLHFTAGRPWFEIEYDPPHIHMLMYAGTRENTP